MPSEHLWAQNLASGPAMTHSVAGSWRAWPQPKDTSILGICLLVSGNISIWSTSAVHNYVLAISTGGETKSCKHL